MNPDCMGSFIYEDRLYIMINPSAAIVTNFFHCLGSIWQAGFTYDLKIDELVFKMNGLPTYAIIDG
ncbi:hypothetical protein J32TS6_32370 [Virgibacillus pantothenticus]|nr:hypothetical protein J32TS6_32370 [Virgibacillus pantothenticus]